VLKIITHIVVRLIILVGILPFFHCQLLLSNFSIHGYATVDVHVVVMCHLL
jgi:hypothetical protein